jgi:DNA-binding response OmpR family regulator
LGHELGVKALINYDLSKIGVLIVEKQAPMRTLLRQVLREFGVKKIDDAMTPEDGFELFCETTPDLVLVDWAPDFDGLKLVQRIRTDGESVFPQVPVIMVTAFNETSYIFEALDAGMTEYMTKPISAKLLYLRIVSVIENKRFFVRAEEFIGPDRRRRKGIFGGLNRREEPAGNTGAKTTSPDETTGRTTVAC